MTLKWIANPTRRTPAGRPRRLFPLLAASVAWMAVGCAGFNQLPQEDGLHPRLTRFAYLEEGQLISLVVDTESSRYREDSKFVPFGVAVAVNRLPRLTLTRESFTLIDDTGKRYPLASIAEARSQSSLMTADLRQSRQIIEVLNNRFSAWQPLRAVFFPLLGEVPGEIRRLNPVVGDRSIVQENVELPKQSWMFDVLYFPHPEGKLMNRKLELWMNGKELENPIFVKFKVR